MSVNLVRAPIVYTIELALNKRTRGGLIERVRFIQHPTPGEEIALPVGSFHCRHHHKKKGEQHTTTKTPLNMLTHFLISLSLPKKGASKERKSYEINNIFDNVGRRKGNKIRD